MDFRSASLAACHLKTFAFLVAPLAAPGLVSGFRAGLADFRAGLAGSPAG